MPTPLPQTINQVLQRLDLIIEETITSNNYLGIFAYVYRRTTAQIKQAIIDQRFEDNERMEKFDVIFANRYIEAYDNFKSNQPISKSWETAFLAKDKPLTILQHLMMGMNAHISFDLGMAVATTTPVEDLHNVKDDFMHVNQILQEITEEMQTRMSRVSRFMFLLDWVGARNDEEIIQFGIVNARTLAWKFATGVSALEGAAKNALVEKTDSTVAKLNELIQQPPGRILKGILRVIYFFEEKKVRRIIENFRK